MSKELLLQEKFRSLVPNYEQYLKAQEEQQQRWQKMREAYELEAKEEHHRHLLLNENIRLFFQTEGLYVRDPSGRITSQQLYEIYKQWCLEQNIPLHPPREFWLHAKNNAAKYHLVYSAHIPDGSGKRYRGFYGVRQLKETEKAPPRNESGWCGWCP